MCHLILLMPLVTIPIFWMAPLPVAIPVYGVILFLSVWLYYMIVKTMHTPVATGSEGLLQDTGEVVGKDGEHWYIRTHGELWDAESTAPLNCGDMVRVIDVDGLVLKVSPVENRQEASRSADASESRSFRTSCTVASRRK